MAEQLDQFTLERLDCRRASPACAHEAADRAGAHKRWKNRAAGRHVSGYRTGPERPHGSAADRCAWDHGLTESSSFWSELRAGNFYSRRLTSAP